LNNQQIINENKNLKEKDFKNKISELRQEIHGVKRELSGFIKHNNLEKEKTRIDESLDNFKIIYNETDFGWCWLGIPHRHGGEGGGGDYGKIRELETQLSEMTKNRDDWKKQSEEWKKQANEIEEQLKEYEKHKKEVEDKITEIMITHLNISRIEIEKLTTVGKLDTILNFIRQEVKECLRLLGIPFQTGDSLISMLKKLVKACKEIGITGPVQEMLLRCLKTLDPKTQINDPKSFGTVSLSMDALVKACYENSRDILNKERFENRPEISFVRKLMRCHYYMVGKSNLLSVKTMADNLFKVTDPESEKMFNRKIWKNIVKKEYNLLSIFNPKYNYINILLKDAGYYRYGEVKYDETFLYKLHFCYWLLKREKYKISDNDSNKQGIDDMSVDDLFEPIYFTYLRNKRNRMP
ncbi:33652_t:CDS:2, partial [Racocetra persica]